MSDKPFSDAGPILGPINGKGSRPRSGFNDTYRANYDSINWGPKAPAKKTSKRGKK